MSQQLISHSSDLKKLMENGFAIEIREAFLLINDVPYVNSNREIKYGTLVTNLTLAGNNAKYDGNHVVYFSGDFPCHKDGSFIEQIRHVSNNQTLQNGLEVNHSFSNKPRTGYKDYFEKMSTYIEIISAPAKSLDDTVTEKTFKVVEFEGEESVFNYPDTNSSRAEISHITDKFKSHKIGIIGLGGTGSYILDLVSKTPVHEIHLFDGDIFVQHNAFRAPGAISIEKLNKTPNKTEYYKEIYSNMHKNIHSHVGYITPSNTDQLGGFDFVFICIDRGEVKKSIINKLEENNIAFIDVGMGVHMVSNQLIGTIRVTSSIENNRGHIKDRISFSDEVDNEYASNIQIADLNMLNASFAVIKWKKLCGFYHDSEQENHSTYSVNMHQLLGEDNAS